jgi:hypothetical protein
MTDEPTAERLRRALTDATVHIGVSRASGTDVIRRGRVVRRRRTTVFAGVATLAVVAVTGLVSTALGHLAAPQVAGSGVPTAPPSSLAASPNPVRSPSPATNPPGVRPGTVLTPHTGDLTIRTDGAVIQGWDLTGSLDVYANNVTVVDTRITSSNWWGINLRAGYTGLKVLHSNISGAPGHGPDHGAEDYAVRGAGGTVEVGYADLSRFANLIQLGKGRIHDSYLHDVQAVRGDGGRWQGTNGIVADAATGLTIDHNTVLNEVPADHGATCAIGLFADTGPVSGVVVDSNVLGGGAYAFYGGGTAATGVRVTGNRFTTQVQPHGGFYGPVSAWHTGGTGNVWHGNVWADGPSAGRLITP